MAQLTPSVTNPTISDVYDKIQSGRLNLQPDFQRRFVWTIKHQEEFIGTILEGYPFPEIYVCTGEYDFENMRVRTLKAMNNLNMMLTIHLGYIAMLADKIDRKLLVIKIIEASKSLRRKIIVWLSQISRGIKEILKYCHTGIKEWQDIEQRPDNKQLQLKL